jgi:hypothetical protein
MTAGGENFYGAAAAFCHYSAKKSGFTFNFN